MTATATPRRDKAKEQIEQAVESIRIFCNSLDWDNSSGEIWLDGEIGPDMFGFISAAAVRKALKAVGNRKATLYLSSPGGSVDEGVAIYNAIVSHRPGVDIVVTGLAASMGSYILQAGRTRVVYQNAVVMIHNPWGLLAGDAEQLRKEAEILDKYGERLVAAYATRSGKSPAEVQRLMDDETWYNGQEIIDAGFADALTVDGSWSLSQPLKIAGAYPRRRAAKSRIAKSRWRECNSLV